MSDSHQPSSRVHLCDCNRSFALDAERLAPAACHHALCGLELPALEASLARGQRVHVACTQETALFGELAEAQGAGERIRFFNLRENAGWSVESAAATPPATGLASVRSAASAAQPGLARSPPGSSNASPFVASGGTSSASVRSAGRTGASAPASTSVSFAINHSRADLSLAMASGGIGSGSE